MEDNLTISTTPSYEDFFSTTVVIADRKCPKEATGCERYPEEMRRLYLYGTLPLILFCAISIAINIKILITSGWIRRPLSPTLHISLSLAGADAFSSTALAIGLVMNSFIPHGLGLQLTDAGCFLLGLEAVRLGGVMITVGHLVALAVNHYLGIVKPLHYLTIMTHGITSFLLVLLWMSPLVFFFAYFAAVENEGFQSQDCTINTFLFKRKFRVMFSSLFFGPFVIMVCIYTHIFCIVRKHQASRLRFSRVGSSFRRNGSRKGDREESNVSQQMARNVKAVNTTLFILGSFVVSWLPATFLYILVCEDCPLGFDWITGAEKFLVYNASNCLIILKTLINPIIYAARMHEIQLASKRMHSSLFGDGRVANDPKARRRIEASENGLVRLSTSRRTLRPLTINDNSANNEREEPYRYVCGYTTLPDIRNVRIHRYGSNNTFV